MGTANIYLSESDYEHLSCLLENLSRSDQQSLRGLEEELDRAQVKAEAEMPKDVVRMGSTVLYEDLESGRSNILTLAYPHRADLSRQRISVLAPAGAALLGLRVGDVIEWPVTDGKLLKLRVKHIA